MGGLGILILLGKTHLHPPTFVIYIAVIIGFFYLFFNIYMTYHRIKHIRIRYIIKSGQADVRNSPF
jgi:hypothetical protein